MAAPQVSAYGSWISPITSDLIVSKAVGLGQIVLDGEDVYWLESRPNEDGRSVIVRRSPDGRIQDITPPPFNVRTRVHEYGGGAFIVDRGKIYFSNFVDQRLYRQEPESGPVPVTLAGDLRFADGIMDRNRNRILCVCEDHTGSEVINKLVGVNLDQLGDIRELAAGNDFYASPRISPDGSHLAWLTWNHPDMPWDSTELWLGEIGKDGTIGHSQKIAGGPDESICQPEFSPDGLLHFVSDRSGWWNLFRLRDRQIETLCRMEADFGEPHWVFAQSRYGFASAEKIICSYVQNGISYLGSLDVNTNKLQQFDLPYSWVSFLRVSDESIVFLGGSPAEATVLVCLKLGNPVPQILERSSEIRISKDYISIPQEIEFPTESGLTSHGFYYPPLNGDFEGPLDHRPPLLVLSHGGPTSQATNVLSLMIQYWTSRGFAVVNVNYGGSSGYGRAYRRRLNGWWGIVDVDDCLNAARYLIERGKVDPDRIAIRGGSAGGYTTLAALTFRSLFKSGASYYGVSDLEALEKDTHKFESHYLDSLIGPYPEQRELFLQRSPINFVGHLSSPVIFFQGAEDKVVPPAQSELMVNALRRKGIPVAYLLFEHEQHGFRIAQNIKRALEAEFYFYSRIFRFDPADQIAPVNIENLNS